MLSLCASGDFYAGNSELTGIIFVIIISIRAIADFEHIIAFTAGHNRCRAGIPQIDECVVFLRRIFVWRIVVGSAADNNAIGIIALCG